MGGCCCSDVPIDYEHELFVFKSKALDENFKKREPILADTKIPNLEEFKKLTTSMSEHKKDTIKDNHIGPLSWSSDEITVFLATFYKSKKREYRRKLTSVDHEWFSGFRNQYQLRKTAKSKEYFILMMVEAINSEKDQDFS